MANLTTLLALPRGRSTIDERVRVPRGPIVNVDPSRVFAIADALPSPLEVGLSAAVVLLDDGRSHVVEGTASAVAATLGGSWEEVRCDLRRSRSLSGRPLAHAQGVARVQVRAGFQVEPYLERDPQAGDFRVLTRPFARLHVIALAADVAA